MSYHGLRKWSAREMREIANNLSRRPKFYDGQTVETKRDNGCCCSAEIISSWQFGNTFKYWVKIGYDRVIRNENEIW